MVPLAGRFLVGNPGRLLIPLMVNAVTVVATPFFSVKPTVYGQLAAPASITGFGVTHGMT